MQDDSSDKKKLLHEDKNNINKTHQTSQEHSKGHEFYSVTKKEDKSKKTKLWIGIGIGAAVVIAVVITLCVVLTKEDSGDAHPNIPNPPGPPPGPIIFYNNYSINDDTLSFTGDTYSGYIIQQGNYNSELHQQALRRLYEGLPQADQAHVYASPNPNIIPQGENNRLIKNVSFQFSMNDYKVGFMRLTDANSERYSIPSESLNGQYINPTMRLEMLGFQLFKNPFSFSFTDVADKSNVFVHTNHSSLVFMDKYIQMDFQLPSQRVFGLGERVREFRLNEGTWTMWAKGADSPYDDGTGGKQVYGVHPFALVQGKKKGDFFGIFFRNSNAQSPILRYNQDGTSTLSYITTGGMLEVLFFLHGSAKSVIQQYQNFVGHPALPPFWSLGWQQASWKYLNQSMVEEVVQKYKDNNLPLDVMWLDIPYMNGYADFTVDNKTAFKDIKGLANNLHANSQKLVVILDAGLSADDLNNKYYQAAQKYDILIKTSIHKDEYNGALVMKVWPNQTVFIDWFNTDAAKVWHQGLADLFSIVPYDGLWLDMSEATGFCDGECPAPAKQQEMNAKTVDRVVRKLSDSVQQGNNYGWYYSYPDQSTNSTYYLPFIPGYNNAGNLDTMTLSLNATNPSINETQYNVHSLYGLMMAKVTQQYLLGNSQYEYANNDNRPFILTRSTFAGSGQYTSHWLGDNWRDWAYMNYSIAGIMNMNMFGIPQSGADVCGFFGEKRDDEMCARWIQLAAFYPFARAHQNLTWKGNDSERSEPYYLAEPWITLAREALYKRYQYLRHYYTCLFEVSQWGGSCFDPLFYYFPTDDSLFENIESSFMIGGSLKVSPILNKGVGDTYEAYFPQGVWVNLDDMNEVIDASKGGKTAQLKSNNLNAHLRSGAILPFQDNSQTQYKTVDSLNAGQPKVSLYINRDQSSLAYGTLLLDKGISRAEIKDNSYEYLEFQHSSKSITKFQAAGTLAAQPDFYLDEVRILNAGDLTNVNFACYMDMNLQPVAMEFVYTKDGNYLSLKPYDDLTFDHFKMIYYGNDKVEPNLCSSTSYKYLLSEQTLPDLSGSKATFNLISYWDTLPDVNVTLEMVTPSIVNIRWTFEDMTNHKAPFKVPANIINAKVNNKGAALSNFVLIDDTDGFKLTIKSLQGNNIIDFDGLLYTDYLNVIHTKIYQDKTSFRGIMGLGEKAMPGLFFDSGVYSYWSLDTANPPETGKVPGNNLYGTHPFYMFKREFTEWAGVFTNLAAASDWYIDNNPEEGYTSIRTIATGGIADIYVIVGSDPKQIVADYHNFIVGRPVLIPVYALGWNQCKWGYKNTQELQDVVDNYYENEIPLDNMWSDIDYLNAYRDFTFDPLNYADLPTFILNLQKNALHYVPIIDAGIAMRPWGNYTQYNTAKSSETGDIFIKANENNTDDFIGYVWPDQANYPDWYHPNATNWYISSLQYLHDTLGIEFDGLWLDMNEASNFCSGPCFFDQAPKNSVLGKLKYVPTNRDLNSKSISVDAIHYGGVLEFDTHSLYGTQEVYSAYQYFQKNNKRTFIIERSSYAGMGKYGSVWLGDNFSTIEYLKYSIGGTMLMNIFGIPLAGADICGFIWDTTAELCARWTVAGAFYPFSRNHNNWGQKPQEPYQFKDIPYEQDISYMEIMTNGIRNKYYLMRYYYTEMFKMSVYGTGAFYTPLFFHFPSDESAYENINNNIMLGAALKLSVLTDALDQNKTDFYFPAGTWCNIYVPTEPCKVSVGETYTLSTKAYDFYVHLFEGHIVPWQEASYISSTYELTNHPVDFHILGAANVLGHAWYSSGTYINDDGETLNTNQNYNQYSIVAMADMNTPTDMNVTITQVKTADNYKDILEKGCSAVNKNDYIGKLYIYAADAYTGLSFKVTVVKTDKTTVTPQVTAAYNTNTNRIETTDINLCMTSIAAIKLTKI